jgi:outer membrane protein TolC
MGSAHEPNSEFVDRLEAQIGREVRQRNRVAHAPSWTQWSRLKTSVVVTGLMLVSMAVGAGAVVAAYEVQGNELRGQLTSSYQQRADLARQRLDLATSQLALDESRVAKGLASNADLMDVRLKVAQAQAELQSIQLQIEEVRATGREPRDEVSAPLVAGRDFVIERLRVSMSVPEKALDAEQTRLRETERRVSIGVGDAGELDTARLHVLEVQAALETVRKKIDIRQKFLAGGADAIETDLRVLEAEAEQRRQTLPPKLDLARKEVDRIGRKVQIGVAGQIELSKAQLQLLQLQMELTKADLELAMVRRQIEQHRVGK